MARTAKIALAFALISSVGACDSTQRDAILLIDDRIDARPSDETVAQWPLDMRLDVAIERIIELRGRAARGVPIAQARLGTALDAEEADLWRARQAERERLGLSRLTADGVIDESGAVRIDRGALRARLEEARVWTIAPRRSRHLEDLSKLGAYAMMRQADRERAIALAEMAILRRLIAATDAQ